MNNRLPYYSISADMVRGGNLVFSRTQPNDTKVYTCKATNWVASVYKSVELVVLGYFIFLTDFNRLRYIVHLEHDLVIGYRNHVFSATEGHTRKHEYDSEDG